MQPSKKAYTITTVAFTMFVFVMVVRLSISYESRAQALAVQAALQLPSPSTKPHQDGSRPALVVRLSNTPPHTQLNGSIETIHPTLDHHSALDEVEIELQTGAVILRQTDLFLPGSPSVALTRTYRSFDPVEGAFGIGASLPYDIWPTGTRRPYTEMDLNLEDGTKIHYPRISEGVRFEDAVYRHDDTASEFYASKIFWNGNGWTLLMSDQRKVIFPEAYYARTARQGAPLEIDDPAGHRIVLRRDTARDLRTIVSAAGVITLDYNGSAQVAQTSDNLGESCTYTYEGTGHLETVSCHGQRRYRFTYERLLDAPGVDSFAMTGIYDRAGKQIVHLAYDRSGKLTTETLPDGKSFQFEYSYVNDDGLTRQTTTVTFPNRRTKTFIFKPGASLLASPIITR